MSNYDSQWKENFSKAYVHAIASQAGWTVGDWGTDIDLIDTTLKKIITFLDGKETEFLLNIQLKCTELSNKNKDGSIPFSIEEDHLKKIKSKICQIPFYYILFNVPKDKNEWIKHEDDKNNLKTIMRYCGYYYNIDDLKSKEESISSKSTTIHFKKEYIFDVNFLNNLISDLKTSDDYIEHKIQILKNLQNSTFKNLN